MENTAQRRTYTGYMGFMYRGKVNEGLRAGLPVEEAIQLAQESMDNIPHLSIDGFDNPLAMDYLDSQKGGVR